MADQIKEFFAFFGRYMGHSPGGLLRGQRCPVPLDDPGTKLQGTARLAVAGRPVQAALDPHRPSGTGVDRLTASYPVVPLPFDRDLGHIEIETGQFPPQGCTLRCPTQSVQRLLEMVEILDRSRRFSTLTQKALELIHGGAIAGQ